MIGIMLVRWNEQPGTLACPRCNQPENAWHIWQCQDSTVFFVWALLMSSLSKWLKKVHAANSIIHRIIQRLTKWRISKPFSPALSDMPGFLSVDS
jgi:hypothetical protein